MHSLTAQREHTRRGDALATHRDLALALLPDDPLGAVALLAQRLTAAGRDADAAHLAAALSRADDPTDPTEVRQIIRALTAQTPSPTARRSTP